MDADLNKYDLNHITHRPSAHVARRSGTAPTSWRGRTTTRPSTSRRSCAARSPTGASASNALFLITWFKGCIDIENVHPLEGGFLRMKFRRDRRPALPIEPVWSFYPKYWLETVAKQCRWASLYLRLRLIYLRIKHDPKQAANTPISR